MRIAVCSDLHLEFGPLSLENNDNADVLVLSGDILVATDLTVDNERSQRWHTFMDEVCDRFPHVVYVMGNHEHYHGDFAKSFGILQEKFRHHENLHLLDKDWFHLDGVTFIGGTLWTDMNKEDPMTINFAARRMNDYNGVNNSNKDDVHYTTPIYAVKENGDYDFNKVVSKEFHTRPARFDPEDSVVDHKAMLDTIDGIYNTLFVNSPVVVCGHHAPCKASTKPGYARDVQMNGCYSSELTEFILDHPRIKLWTHGHTHDPFDYMVGTTRILCNPRGYINYEGRADDFELVTVEV